MKREQFLSVFISVALACSMLAGAPVLAAEETVSEKEVEVSEPEKTTDEAKEGGIEADVEQEISVEETSPKDKQEETPEVMPEDVLGKNDKESSEASEQGAEEKGENPEQEIAEEGTDQAQVNTEVQDQEQAAEPDNEDELQTGSVNEEDAESEQEKQEETGDNTDTKKIKVIEEVVGAEDSIPAQAASTFKLHNNSISLNAGSKDHIHVEVDHYGEEEESLKKISAVSSNTAIVSVQTIEQGDYDGDIEIIGLKPGEATITVTKPDGRTENCLVTVKSFLPYSAITINSGTERSIEYLCRDTRVVDYISISSTNPKAVSVEKDDDYYATGMTVTGKYPGTTTLTVKLPGGIQSSMKVTVKPKETLI